jgi:hypothetical protein
MADRFNLDNYITVQERVNRFWEENPNGRILTALCSDPDDWETCRYRAEVYADREDSRPITTGYAFEKVGRGANLTSHEENCETSAIGRALANLGFATSHQERPSREEMAKVNRMHAEIASQATESGQRAAGSGQATPVQPPPSRISAVRQRPAEPKPNDLSGLFYSFPDGIRLAPPNVHTQHGVTKGAELNEYLKSAGFDGGNKAAIIKELEGTFSIVIESGRGTNQYGDPDVFPGELYDLARHLIEGRDQAAAQ